MSKRISTSMAPGSTSFQNSTMSQPSMRRWNKSPPRNKQRSPRECTNLIWTDLVDCSISFRTNCCGLLSGPGIQIATTPRPGEGMGKPAVILGPTALQMVDQMLARLGIKAPQVFVRKGAQQQLGLIQP